MKSPHDRHVVPTGRVAGGDGVLQRSPAFFGSLDAEENRALAESGIDPVERFHELPFGFPAMGIPGFVFLEQKSLQPGRVGVPELMQDHRRLLVRLAGPMDFP